MFTIENNKIRKKIQKSIVRCSYVIFFILLSPIYYLNKKDFKKSTKNNPFYISKLVKLQLKYPILYELAMYVQNFPKPTSVYSILPELSGRVLQVGCGTGLLNKYCEKNSSKYKDVKFVNMDLNLNSLLFGKKRNRFDDYVHADICNVPLEDESFDTIIFARCFHHIKYQKKMFKECTRLLKINGKIIILDIALINDGKKINDFSKGAYMANSSIDGIIWRFDKKAFVQMLNKSKTSQLEIQSVEEIRQVNITNYNFKYPQTDIIAVLEKVS